MVLSYSNLLIKDIPMGKSYVLYSSVGSSADVVNDISFDQAIIPRSSGDPEKNQKEYEIFSDI